MVGEGEDITPPYATDAAVILDGRSKSGTALTQNNVLAINNMGVNLAAMKADGSLGLGTHMPSGKLHVHASSGRHAFFTYGNVAVENASLEIGNGTNSTGLYLPYIKGRGHNPGHTFGLYLVGESEDVTSPGSYEAAVILDGRTKTNTRVNNANVLAINSMGINLAVVKADGSMGIGTGVTHGHKLAVAGSGLFTKVVVKQQSAWPDFVFEPEYHLQPLSELAAYIREYKHLPEIPTAADISRDGQDLGEMNRKLLQKVEELTLYIIRQDEAAKSAAARLAELEMKLEKLNMMMQKESSK